MKRFLSFFLAMLMFGCLLCACGEPEDAGTQQDTPSSKELYSQIRYYASVERNGEKTEEEIFFDFDWLENGVVMDGKLTSGEKVSTRREEATFDAEKRPVSITATTVDDEETEHETIDISYDGLKVTLSRLRNDGEKDINVMEYNEQGLLLREESNYRINTYEYDSYGNCVMEKTFREGALESEEKTTYTYDENGKIKFSSALRTYDGEETETQSHYYYYPNGNVMFVLSVTGHADVNHNFRHYNKKDILTWSYGMQASAGGVYKVTKDANGYISSVEVTRGSEVSTAHFEYDAAGNLVKETTFYGTERTWEYDAENRPVKYRNGNTVTTYEYDSQGRLIAENEVRTGDNAYTQNQSYAYNEAGMVSRREMTYTATEEEGTVVRHRVMEVTHIENSNCTVNEQWAEFLFQRLNIF